MATVLKTKFQLRRGNAEVWARNNPVLERGEPGFEIDTGRLKIGNGETAWNDLEYLSPQSGAGGGVQPDWNQNDNTQPDYVKNRPFYTGDPVETETIPATTVTFSKTGSVMMARWPENFDFSVGQTYSISWDGTDYVCSCNLFHDIPVLGNLAIRDMGTDTGEPFLIVNQGTWMAISNDIVSDIATEHSICVKTFVSNIITLDEKYLPPRLTSPLIIDATNLPSDTSGWSELYNQIDGAYNERREILLDLQGNGSSILPCVSWEGSKALFLDSFGNNNIKVYILTAYVSDGGGFIERVVTVQPDWNQNDETAADYIKNRPFYTGDPVETVLVEESTVSFVSANGMHMAEFPSTFAATVGETYKVYWDGAVYECTCVSFNNAPVIGNLSIMGTGSDTGEPFLMVVNNGVQISIVEADASTSHTFSISGFVQEVVKIDRKYLPSTEEYIIPSSTEGSTKKFKITVDDSGTLSATEMTQVTT